MDKFSILQYGEPLNKALYTIDIDNKVFASREHSLELDFGRFEDWTFQVGDSCTLTSGYFCTFKTGHSCTFKTGMHCTFDTGFNCTFRTSSQCTFNTDSECTFNIWKINSCKFKTYDGISTILDRIDKKHYLLTKELVNLQKVVNG